MKILIVLFLILLSHVNWAQNKELDSLYILLSNHPSSDSTKVKLIISICKLEFAKHRDTIPILAGQALSISKEINYAKGMAVAYNYFALYHRANGEFDKVTDYALKMLDMYEHSSDEDGLGQAYNMLGITHFEMKNYDKAQYYHEKSLEVHARSGQRYDMSRNYMNLGVVFSETKKHAEAINSFLKALEIKQEFNNEEGICNAYSNLGLAYVNKAEYLVAIGYFAKALPLAQKANNQDALATIYSGFSEAYSKTGQYEKAIVSADSSLFFAKRVKDKTRLRDAYHALADIEKLRINFKAALLYYELSAAYRDSVFSESKLKQFTDLEAKYETEKKQQTINLLQQENKIKSLTRNLLVAGLAFVVLIAALIYYFQRQKNRKDHQLLTAQESLNTKLIEVDKLKSRFFANISHEFRTPLTLIISPIEEKLSDSFVYNPEKEKISFQSIRRSANRLLELVNQLLELSKLESGFMTLKPQAGNLFSFVMPVLSSFDSLADVGQVRYTKEVRIPEYTLLFDGDKVEKIFNNLLSNAFKFSPKGGRVDAIAVATEKEKSIGLTIEIKNTSVIPPDTLTKIFEPFFQGDNLPTRGVPGTGLGLSLVKELVKLHNGNIEATSSVSEGTVFRVTLSFEKSDLPATLQATEKQEASAFAEQHEENIPTEIDAVKETILIVEDNADVRTLIRHGLEAHYNIVEASTGKEGVEAAQEKSVDLVISDVMMPVMGGVELCHILKNDELTSHVPIILLTARADHESKLEGISTGADDYVTKPFNMQELQARVANLIAQRKRLIQKYNQRVVLQPHEITVTPLDERFVQKTIELMEDNLDNTELTVDSFTEEMGMSRTNLHRKLKAITGLSTAEFIQDFRLRRAAILIEKKVDSVSQIAYQVGFNDHSYFTKCFKKKFGKNPSEYGEKAS